MLQLCRVSATRLSTCIQIDYEDSMRRWRTTLDERGATARRRPYHVFVAQLRWRPCRRLSRGTQCGAADSSGLSPTLVAGQRGDVADYIDAFYSPTRRHGHLDGRGLRQGDRSTALAGSATPAPGSGRSASARHRPSSARPPPADCRSYVPALDLWPRPTCLLVRGPLQGLLGHITFASLDRMITERRTPNAQGGCPC
jgi:hypothetical protein